VIAILLATFPLHGAFAVFSLFIQVHIFVHTCCRQHFSWQDFDGRSSLRRQRGHNSIPLRLTMIVILKVFEDVADIQKRIAIQADIHERRLHARQNARDFSLVDAADERELFLTLNVDLD